MHNRISCQFCSRTSSNILINFPAKLNFFSVIDKCGCRAMPTGRDSVCLTRQFTSTIHLNLSQIMSIERFDNAYRLQQQQIVMLHNVLMCNFRHPGSESERKRQSIFADDFLLYFAPTGSCPVPTATMCNNRHPMNLIYYLFYEITRLSNIVVMMRRGRGSVGMSTSTPQSQLRIGNRLIAVRFRINLFSSVRCTITE